jgi:transposase
MIFTILLRSNSMFRTDLTSQPNLFPLSVREMITDDSDVWLYIDLFDQLDLSLFVADYVEQGQAGIDPTLMLRSIFYGLTHGVVSGRKLAQACRSDVRYLVLSGEQRPDFRTFHRFLERHLERMEVLFVQIVRLAQQMGLVSLGRIAIDGSRFKANTSKHKAMSYGRMQQAIEQIKQELARLKAEWDVENASSKTHPDDSLPEAIRDKSKRLARIEAAKQALESEVGEGNVDPKSQKSFNDHDAMPMARHKGEFTYGYNAQAAVDETSQVIVAAELHDSPADMKALPDMLEKVDEVCGKNPDEVLADSGYHSGDNLMSIESGGMVPLIANALGEKSASVNASEHLVFTGTAHQYQCMIEKPLKTVSRQSNGKTIISIPTGHCDGCDRHADCQLYSKREAKTISVAREDHRQAIVRNAKRLRSESGKKTYRSRKAIVEPVFGNIKSNKGINILVKGRKKVAAWWKMAATAHNIEKVINRLALAM